MEKQKTLSGRIAQDMPTLDEIHMNAAILQAQLAEEMDEVPVGAIMLFNNTIIAQGHNLRESNQDPLAHAEIAVIAETAKKLGSWRLLGCQLYVTLEPCPMCAGAIVNARIPRVIFGAYDEKAGAFGTVYNLAEGRLNHKPEITGGVLRQECADLLSNYFKKKRR